MQFSLTRGPNHKYRNVKRETISRQHHVRDFNLHFLKF